MTIAESRALVRRIRDRPNDAPMPTERMLDDAADLIETLLARNAALENEVGRLTSWLEDAIDDYDAENGSRNDDKHWSNQYRIALKEQTDED